MKKYIIKFALLAFSIGLLTSCEEDTVTYSGENFVSLNNVASSRVSFRENVGIAKIPVNLAFARPNDVVITFTDSSDVAIPGVHYNMITPGTITIPAGETTANIEIEIIDNEDIDISRPLWIQLRTVSDSSVNLGLVDVGSYFKRVLIVNNDCTTNFDIWFGDLNVSKDGTVIGTATADFNESGDCNTLLITGELHTSAGEPDDPIIFTFSPNSPNSLTGTVTATEQLYKAGGYTQDGKTYDVNYATATGSVYNETTQTITLKSHVTINTLGAYDDQTIVLTPVE